ncbi:hypothetical protein [Halosimplex amylolyticum]|uniref:hypothetical protein n=1 Tax=Halosimplex amylolyticum TaxID=3396616 RepID=UPI003F5497C0
MSGRLFVFVVLVVASGAVVSTGAFTGGDEAVRGVYLNPADSENGDRYAEMDANGELVIELTDLNSRATTVVDSVFNVSTSLDGAEVWVETASPAVTVYRMDTRGSIGSKPNAVAMSAGETFTAGIRVDSGVSAPLTVDLTVKAVVPTATPTATTASPDPTARSAGGSGDDDTPNTRRPVTTSEPPTPTPTQSPTSTPTQSPTTVPPDDGTTVPDDGTETPTATTEREGSATSVPPATTQPVAEERSPDGPSTTAGTTPGTSGFPFSLLGGLLAALVGLPLLFWGLGWLRDSPALVVTVDSAAGLRVSPGSGDEDRYGVAEGTVSFAFTETESWSSRSEDDATVFADVVTLSNASEESLVVALATDETPDDVRLLVGGDAVLAEGMEMEPGAELGLSVAFPARFDPDEDVTVGFEARPPTE